MLLCHIAAVARIDALTAFVADTVAGCIGVLLRRLLTRDVTAFLAGRRAIVIVGMTLLRGYGTAADRALAVAIMRPRVFRIVGTVVAAYLTILGAVVFIAVRDLSRRTANVTGGVAGIVIGMRNTVHVSFLTAFVTGGITGSGVDMICRRRLSLVFTVEALVCTVILEEVGGNSRLAACRTGRGAVRLLVGMSGGRRSLLVADGAALGTVALIGVGSSALTGGKAFVADRVTIPVVNMRGNSRLAAFITVGVAFVRIRMCRGCRSHMIAPLALRLTVASVGMRRIAVLAALAHVIACAAGLVAVGREYVRGGAGLVFADGADTGAGAFILMLCRCRILCAAKRAGRVTGVEELVRSGPRFVADVALRIALVIVNVIAALLSADGAGVIAIRAFGKAVFAVNARLSARLADLVTVVIINMRRILTGGAAAILTNGGAGIRIFVLADALAAKAARLTTIGVGMILHIGTNVVTRLALRLAGVGELVRRIRTGRLSAKGTGGIAVGRVGMRCHSDIVTYVTGRVAGVVKGVIALCPSAHRADGIAAGALTVVVRGGSGIFFSANRAGLVTCVRVGMLGGVRSRRTARITGGIAVTGVGVLGVRVPRFAAKRAVGVTVAHIGVRCLALFAADAAFLGAGTRVVVRRRRFGRASCGTAV